MPHNKPVPGQVVEDYVANKALWSDVVDMLDWWHKFRAESQVAGSKAVCLPFGWKDSVGNLVPGQLAYLDSTVQPTVDSIPIDDMKFKPVLKVVNPVWHTKIDKVVVLHKGILANSQSSILSPRLLPAIGTIVSGADKYVMVDPADPKKLKTSTSGIFGLFGTLQLGDDTILIVDTATSQPLWRYETTAASDEGIAPAKLLRLDGATYADDIILTDIFNTLGGSGSTGFCIQAGNKFMALNGGDVKGSAFELTADLASGVGSTATATLADTSSVVVTNTGGWRSFTGATCYAIRVGNIWQIVHVNEPGDLLATLGGGSETRYPADPREATANISPTPTPTVITQYPQSLYKEVSFPANPLKLYGEEGDKCILRWSRELDAYMVAEIIPAQQRMFWSEILTAESGLTPHVYVNAIDPLTAGTIPTEPIEVLDLFDRTHNTKVGDRCLVLWDNAVGQYVALECTHTTTRFLGTLFEDFDDAPTTFKVDHVRSFNGTDPDPATEIDAENRWNWRAGVEGDEIEVAWDPTTETWYPIQIKPYENLLPLYVY